MPHLHLINHTPCTIVNNHEVQHKHPTAIKPTRMRSVPNICKHMFMHTSLRVVLLPMLLLLTAACCCLIAAPKTHKIATMRAQTHTHKHTTHTTYCAQHVSHKLTIAIICVYVCLLVRLLFAMQCVAAADAVKRTNMCGMCAHVYGFLHLQRCGINTECTNTNDTRESFAYKCRRTARSRVIH